MSVIKMVYAPSDDSWLLLEQVKRFAKGRVLDMGAGSGVLALEAAKNAGRVVAVDIDTGSVAAVRRAVKHADVGNVSVVKSDLFSSISKQNFDVIIFNPPYLPRDKGVKDLALYGGKKGYEIIGRFLSEANSWLDEKGVILLLFSSLTNRAMVDGIIRSCCFDSELLSEKGLFFERLFVYRIWKSELLKVLNKKKVCEVRLFARGKRGLVYTGVLSGRKVAVKVQRTDIAAKGTVNREARWLKLLNRHGIGAKLIFKGNDYFCYGFVGGLFISDFVSSSSKQDIIRVLRDVLRQCYALDRLKVNKEEMHKPLKHIVVDKLPVLIDFERAKRTAKPHNVTQFCQFLISRRFGLLLEKKGITIKRQEIIQLAGEYKKDVGDKAFKRLLFLVG